MRYGSGRIFRPKRGDGSFKSSRWSIAFYVDGEEVRESAGTEKQAERLLRQRLKELARDTYVTPENERLTVNELLDIYRTDLEERGKKSNDTTMAHAKAVRDALGDRRALALRSEDFDRYRKDRRDAKKAKQTIDKELGCLRAAYRMMQKKRRFRDVPFVPMYGKSGDIIRRGFIEPQNFEAFVGHFPEWLQEVVRFAYRTAWRKGEILGLTWENVDRVAGEIRLFTSKNDDGRTIPLQGGLAELIERCWRRRRFAAPGVEPATWVFLHRGRRIGDFRKAWKAGCEAAGMPGLRFHDLRRSGVRNYVRSGVSQHVAMSMTGHKTIDTFRRYDVTSSVDKKLALQSVEAYVSANSGKD